jgi:hypothetical protein
VVLLRRMTSAFHSRLVSNELEVVCSHRRKMGATFDTAWTPVRSFKITRLSGEKLTFPYRMEACVNVVTRGSQTETQWGIAGFATVPILMRYVAIPTPPFCLAARLFDGQVKSIVGAAE